MKKSIGSVFLAFILFSVLLSGCSPTTQTTQPTQPTQPTPPTYSEVLTTYPEGTDLCTTEAVIEDEFDGGWALNGKVEVKDNQRQVQCFGTKITTNISITIDGITYPPGSMLTVDKNLEWITVSSWD